MTAINLSNTSVNLISENCSSTIDVTADTVTWQAVSSQTWLTLSSDSTTKGDGKITIKVSANPTTAIRTALVTVSAIGAPSQTIVVTQDAGLATIKDVSNNNQVLYPNPARESFIINLIETAKIEVYSVSNWFYVQLFQIKNLFL